MDDGHRLPWGWVFSLLAAASAASAAEVRVATVRHRGFDNCVEVTAGKTHLVVVPAWAGRISVLDFGWGNVLWSDPKLDGKTLPPNEEWMPWDGNATDIVRTDGKRQWKGLWLHPWPRVEPIADGVKIHSDVKTEADLSAERVYRLSPDGRTLGYHYVISYEGGPPKGWTIWERALVPAGGYVIAPIAKGGAFPDGSIVRDKASVEPPDRAVSVGGFLVMKAGTKQGVGLATRLRGEWSWIGHVRDGHVLLMAFGVSKEGMPEPEKGWRVVLPPPEEVRYAHYGGAHAAFWLAPEKIEIEPLASEVTLDASRCFTQIWHGLDLPPSVSPDDPVAVGQWLDKEAAARTEWFSKLGVRMYYIRYR